MNPPWQACGAGMELLRACYRSNIVPAPAAPMPLPGAWRWCRDGAKPLPFAHAFGSRNWDWDSQDLSPPVGEQKPRGTFVSGNPLPGAGTHHYHGSQADWRGEVRYDPATVGVVYPDCPAPIPPPLADAWASCSPVPFTRCFRVPFPLSGQPDWLIPVTWRAPIAGDPLHTNGVYVGTATVTTPITGIVQVSVYGKEPPFQGDSEYSLSFNGLGPNGNSQDVLDCVDLRTRNNLGGTPIEYQPGVFIVAGFEGLEAPA